MSLHRIICGCCGGCACNCAAGSVLVSLTDLHVRFTVGQFVVNCQPGELLFGASLTAPCGYGGSGGGTAICTQTVGFSPPLDCVHWRMDFPTLGNPSVVCPPGAAPFSGCIIQNPADSWICGFKWALIYSEDDPSCLLPGTPCFGTTYISWFRGPSGNCPTLGPYEFHCFGATSIPPVQCASPLTFGQFELINPGTCQVT